jgi:hypothetical protein
MPLCMAREIAKIYWQIYQEHFHMTSIARDTPSIFLVYIVYTLSNGLEVGAYKVYDKCMCEISINMSYDRYHHVI